MAQAPQTITQTPREERSLGDLFTELATESSTLIRQEIALAQSEITQKATRAGTQIAYVVVGGVFGLLAGLALLAGIIIGLGQLISNLAKVEQMTGAWIAAFIVAAVIGGVAAYLITSSLDALRKVDMTPHKTVQSLKEDAQWVKDQVS